MPKFTAENQPDNKGRKKGSRNRKSMIDDLTQQAAKERLGAAVSAGEQWAILAVLDRTMPKLRPVTVSDSLDGEMLRLKIKEISDIEQRVKALEVIKTDDRNR